MIDGKREHLGTYDSPESYKLYAKLISGERPKPEDKPEEAAKLASAAPTLTVLMAGYLKHAIKQYGGNIVSEVVHLRLAFRILRESHATMLVALSLSPQRRNRCSISCGA